MTTTHLRTQCSKPQVILFALIACLSVLQSSAALADPGNKKRETPEDKAVGRFFCSMTAHAVKKEVRKRLKDGGCLLGARNTPSNARLCNQATIYRQPDPDGNTIVTSPSPLFACTTCTLPPPLSKEDLIADKKQRDEEAKRCGLEEEMALNVDIAATARYVFGKSEFAGSMNVSANLAFESQRDEQATVSSKQGTGRDGPANIIDRVTAFKFRYNGASILEAKVSASSPAYGAALKLGYERSCVSQSWGDTFLFTKTVNRACEQPLTLNASVIMSEGTPSNPQKTVSVGPTKKPVGGAKSPGDTSTTVPKE